MSSPDLSPSAAPSRICLRSSKPRFSKTARKGPPSRPEADLSTSHSTGPWSDEALLADSDATALLLEDAAERNFERWPVLGEYVWPNDFGAEDRSTYAEEVDDLRDWLTDRAAWIDQQLAP